MLEGGKILQANNDVKKHDLMTVLPLMSKRRTRPSTQQNISWSKEIDEAKEN